MSPRIGTITTTLSLRVRSAVEEASWRDQVRFHYREDAERVIERADELSMTTTMERVDVREQAEREMNAIYAERIRALSRG